MILSDIDILKISVREHLFTIYGKSLLCQHFMTVKGKVTSNFKVTFNFPLQSSACSTMTAFQCDKEYFCLGYIQENETKWCW